MKRLFGFISRTIIKNENTSPLYLLFRCFLFLFAVVFLSVCRYAWRVEVYGVRRRWKLVRRCRLFSSSGQIGPELKVL
ncbi:hypothetical protein ERO13_A06G138204v2 [Gossypium hirsutum]|uniref:Uncharacterized protein n=1 Tax=Gossypium darwinii TaxID=34276 RepID=A0A5D2G4E3_GOSDA|nr:hypothetical protein ERO13_A06G138204v2 [Gossypium hirsutum]TYH13057.1 hypothetical protein ES288_A06G114200v1 [Gossypium darwinii]